MRRNKKSLALNLRPQAGRDALIDLLARAHVLIENYRPGTLEEMGLGPDVLHARNPGADHRAHHRLRSGRAVSRRPGFGTLVEAMSGFASKNGFGDRPPVLPPLALADMVAGLYGAYAVMIALRVVEHGGKGQVIDLPLLDPIISILGPGCGDLSRVGREAAAHRQPLADHVAAQCVCDERMGGSSRSRRRSRRWRSGCSARSAGRR